MDVPAQGKRKFTLPRSFCPSQTLNERDHVHPHWRRQSSSLSPPTEMLISSENTLTDTPRNNVLPAIWAHVSLVKLTQKINHHTCQNKLLYI